MGRRTGRPDPRLVDSRNRVALPRAVLAALDLRPGDYVTFLVDELGGVRMHRLELRLADPPGRA